MTAPAASPRRRAPDTMGGMSEAVSVLPRVDVLRDAQVLEQRGRWWLIGSFLLCPCHLPLTLGVLIAVLGGTSLGAFFRDNAWVAGGLITFFWLLGTTYGFRLIRKAQRSGGACAAPRR